MSGRVFRRSPVYTNHDGRSNHARELNAGVDHKFGHVGLRLLVKSSTVCPCVETLRVQIQ